MIVIQLIKFFVILLFTIENLHHSHAGDIFLQKCVNASNPYTNEPVNFTNQFLKQECDVKQQRQNRKSNKRQFSVTFLHWLEL